jgi:hypothetical protein
MQELFEVLRNFKPKHTEPMYYIVLKGREIECLANVSGENHVQVSKEEYLHLLEEGQQNFYFENGKIVRKPPATNKQSYNVLRKSSEGLTFLDSDPYWPTEIAEGGYTWQTSSE